MKDYEKDLRYHVLNVLQILTMLGTVLAATSNIVNQRPLNVIMQPVVGFFIILGTRQYSKKNQKRRHFAKLIYMVFFCVFFLPVAWYYSPGISSAIGYYAMMIILMAVFFVEHPLEFIFPIISIGISTFMIRYELMNTAHFIPFPSKTVQINDVTFNFLAVVIIMALIIAYINRHYVQEKLRFYRLSITDELTGVYNRRHLLNCLEDLVNDSNRKAQIALLFIDVNHFKWVNDTYGHLEGDAVLIKLGEMLKSTFPICGRFGGDEFMVILPSTSLDQANEKADALRCAFEAYANAKSYTKLSLSVGVYSGKDESAQELIRKADAYMYQIKHEGR